MLSVVHTVYRSFAIFEDGPFRLFKGEELSSLCALMMSRVESTPRQRH